MTSLVPVTGNGGLTRKDPRRLSLFKNTIGKDLVGTELDEAIEWCEIYGANPFTKDIYFFIFDANDPKRRRVVPVLSIGLYRKIAARGRNYRPDPQAPRFTYDETLKGPGNPAGILDCELSVYQFSHGEWFPVTERIRWEERAPLIEHCAAGYRYETVMKPDGTPDTWEDSGKTKKKRVPKGDLEIILDPKKEAWHRMPETMLAKCVEAAAIRKGWPNETAGSYVEGELDAAHTIELQATDITAQYEAEEKLALIGGKDALIVDWCGGGKLARVPMSQFCDAVLAWSKGKGLTATELRIWWQRNEMTRAEFKARHGSDYLELQKAFEARVRDLERAEAVAAE
jgi:phage recombination protein Bet